jgi:glycosyltransferase involved in cell wall biosynthesis
MKMNILYISSYLDKKYFNEIFEDSKIKPMQSIQKFNNLLVSGLAASDKVENIQIISIPPVNNKMNSKVLWGYKKHKDKKINFKYAPMINLPIIKFVSILFSSIPIVISWCLKKDSKEKVLIYDGFFPVLSNVSVLFCKLFRIKIVGLYTDLPKCMNHNENQVSWFSKLKKKIINIGDYINLKICDAFILLTDQMNDVINLKNKPYIVMEGLVDSDFRLENNILNKHKDKIFFYAGGLYEKYGIKALIDAFIKIKNKNIGLHLYGSGDLNKYIEKVAKKDKRVFFGGVARNEDILIEESKATVLVNPRFTDEEYTKYSFPSKNMEYMTTGTPILTTNLPGMPADYKKYIYIIEKETVQGIKEKIEELILKNPDELHEMGMNAQKFVLKNKNNLVQTEKIIKLIEKI